MKSGYNEQYVLLMTKKSSFTWRRAAALIGTSWFLRGVLALLVLQALWIALSGRYPMAFDEDYHLGLIRLFAHHLSPFWDSQPAGADAFGAVVRDPSYLYHYVMSFPYRLISIFTDSLTWQVLWLRAINIGIFTAGLAVYGRLLLKTGASRTIVNLCLLIFVLIPVMPLLAAQVNYDSLFLLLTGVVLLWAVDISDELRKGHLYGSRLALLIGVGFLASLVKYAFLPIFVTVAIFLVIRIWQTHTSVSEFGRSLLSCMKNLGWLRRILLILFVLLAGAVCFERYGINLIRYHTPVPDCSAVLSVKQCSAYGPWVRDHTLELQKIEDGDNPLIFGAEWLYGMWLRLFFAVDGPSTQFQTKGPFIVPALSAVLGMIAGTVLVLRYGRRLFTQYNTAVLSLFAAVSGFYILVLLADGYEAYRRTGQAVAINGRYLLPILLPILLFGLLAGTEWLKHKPRAQAAVVSAMILCLLWGGGALTYILRSNDAWYWPNSTLRRVNHAVQRTVGPLVPGYTHPSQFLH